MANLPITQAHLNKQRKDRFTLVLSLPNIFKEITARAPRDDKFVNLDALQFSVYNATIPQIAVPEHPLPFGGQNYNVTSYNRPPYPPVSINFEVDNEFKNYWVLWKWLALMNDPVNAVYAGKESFETGKPDQVPKVFYDYVTDITLYAKDEYHKTKAEFIFKYAFITKLGELDFNQRDKEQMPCLFEFVFNQLEVNLV